MLVATTERLIEIQLSKRWSKMWIHTGRAFIMVTIIAGSIGCYGPSPVPVAEASQSALQEKSMTKAPTSKDELRQLVQMTIDLDALDKYYHSELPGRKPLCIVKNNVINSDLTLKKFGQPVRFLPAAEAKKTGAACIEFSKIEIQDDAATVEFAYVIEGIRGTAKFRKTGGAWRSESHQLREK